MRSALVTLAGRTEAMPARLSARRFDADRLRARGQASQRASVAVTRPLRPASRGSIPAWRVRQHGVHVGARVAGDADAIGGEARHHWRVERIGDGEGAEQERSALAELRARVLPEIQNPEMSCRTASENSAAGRRAATFSGMAWRSAAKPLCICAASERARARLGCAGHRPASGWRSARYSQMASESQIANSSSSSTGTSPAGETSPTPRANASVLNASFCSVKAMPAARSSQPGAHGPGREILVADDQGVHVSRSMWVKTQLAVRRSTLPR